MIRWLDSLGWLKWPSLILVASPIAAYPSWAPDQAPAVDCGPVELRGDPFRAYRRAEGDFVLRPAARQGRPAIDASAARPIGFDSGGMIVGADDKALRGLSCRP